MPPGQDHQHTSEWGLVCWTSGAFARRENCKSGKQQSANAPSATLDFLKLAEPCAPVMTWPTKHPDISEEWDLQGNGIKGDHTYVYIEGAPSASRQPTAQHPSPPGSNLMLLAEDTAMLCYNWQPLQVAHTNST